jgi:hypothetical protein
VTNQIEVPTPKGHETDSNKISFTIHDPECLLRPEVAAALVRLLMDEPTGSC